MNTLSGVELAELFIDRFTTMDHFIRFGVADTGLTREEAMKILIPIRDKAMKEAFGALEAAIAPEP